MVQQMLWENDRDYRARTRRLMDRPRLQPLVLELLASDRTITAAQMCGLLQRSWLDYDVSSVSRALNNLVSRGVAERFKYGGVVHYRKTAIK